MASRIETIGIARSSDDPLHEHILHAPDRLFDLLPIAVYVCAADGRIVRFNRRAAELWGRAPKAGDLEERFCGSHRLYRLDGRPLPHAESPMAEVLRTGIAAHDREVVIERPDGARRVALFNIDPLTDSAGRMVGAINCFHETTVHARAEARLRENGRQAREVLAALPVALYLTDAEGRITFYNEAAADLWGHRPELGKSEWCGSWRLHWPDGKPMPHDECPMAVALKEGRPIRGAEAVAERPDGTRVPFLAFPTPLRDESGALAGAVNMLVDIAKSESAEQAAQRLISIVESSDDAILSKDLDGVIESWNKGAERLFGYTAEETVGKSVTILIPPDRQDEEPAILGRIRRGERIEHYETVRRRKDGSLVDISLTVSPVRDSKGRIVGASKIARDITERKRAEEQQRLLLGEMRHRVKNLFAVTGGLVALSARAAATPEGLAAAVQARLGALMRAHELTRPGLIGAGAEDSEGTTLHELVRAIFAPYADSERSKGHDRVDFDGPDVPIGGSAITDMALLLNELATNAAKYGALSSPTGSVRVDWSVEKGELLLTWMERGGPPLDGQPDREGFGGLLMRQIVTGQLDGQLSCDWQTAGVTVRLSMPLERLAK